MYLKVVTRYLCIHRHSFVVHSAKKSEVEDIAATTAAATTGGTDESSGVPILTRSKSDNHYLVPFQQGSNIPAKIHNDKFVFKIVVRKWKGQRKGEYEKKMATASCNHS